ncbi:uncharacterized protein [Solanum tuberosum]|uniref:uncharacterized protein n=1 Tax=Solanum tuberosum TaxID=4113 RepID=UPI0003D28C74|nr:PREDICTED: uncharacterized protein LOC102599445 [Solanum tuberosum]
MRLTLIIVIFLLHIHLLHAFSLSSRFLRPRVHVDDEIMTIDKRGGGAASGHASAHGSSSGGRASRGGGSTRSPYSSTAGVIPVYAAGAMNHHNNNVNRSHHQPNDGITLNCICFSTLVFIICSIIVNMIL